jgi:uncharacterized repeat protein (TIGR03803 family)
VPGAPPVFPLVTVLHSFAYWDGVCPRGSLAFGLDGALYGTTQTSGLGGRGTLFRITTAGAFTPVYFFNGANGADPVGGLLRNPVDGHLYGTTRSGGALQGGTIFRLTSNGVFSTLHHFNGAVYNDSAPEAPLMASGNSIYGATRARPFRLTMTGQVTLFDPVGSIQGQLITGASGELYGTASPFPGFGLGGVLFRLTEAGEVTTLYEFSGPDGSHPFAGLQYSPRDGWLYGSTAAGGVYGLGTLYRFFLTGPVVEKLLDFDGANGDLSFTRLTLDLGFDFYGTTVYGGPGNRGVLFKFTRPQ